MSSAVQTPTATVDTIWSSIYTEANKHKQVEVTPSSTANDVTLSHSASTTTGQDFQNSQHHHGNVLILGEESTGKFSLTQMLANKATQQNKDTMATALKYTGLTYKNLNFFDEDSASRGTWGIWLPDSEITACKSQLNTVLRKISGSKDQEEPTSEASQAQTQAQAQSQGNLLGDIDLCLICLDLSDPYLALEQLEKWVDVLNDHIQWNCSTESLEVLYQSVRNKWNLDDETSYVLSKNVGLPLLVVGTKTDKFEDLERNENVSDEIFNFIQYKLRMTCLALGAGLCYTSAKSGQNQDVLYNEILHHIGFRSEQSLPSVIERSSINIPMGWDSLKKIELLQESLLTVGTETDYKLAVPQLAHRKMNGSKSANAGQQMAATLDELHQSFLEKIKVKIAQTNSQSQNQARNEPAGDKTAISLTPGAALPGSLPNGAGTGAAALAGQSAAAAASNTQGATGVPNNDRQLADFFQQLLKKSTGPAGAPGTPQASSSGNADPNLLAKSPLGAMLNKNKK